MNQKVSNKISYLYFGMAFLILNLHSVYMSLFQSKEITNAINQIIRIICNMSVPTFFFVSSLLFYRSCEKKCYKEVILGKVKTLLVPYVCWNIICFPLKELKNILSGEGISVTHIGEIIYKIFMSQYDPVLWFIRVLFIYFLIYPLLLFIIKRPKVCFAIITFIFICNVYIGPVTGYSTLRYWLPIYMMGGYLGYWKKELIFDQNKRFKFPIYIIVVLLTIGIIGIAYFSDLGMYICRMISPLFYWVLGDIFLTEKKPHWIIKQSFYIYCSQMIFSIIPQKIWLAVFGNGNVSAIFSNLGIPLILTFVLALSAAIFHKLLPRVYGVLTGNRAS